MRLHFIDAGQGDAILVEFPCAAMLVDTGAEKNAAYDGEAALTEYLDAFFRRRQDLGRTIHLLVISHPHKDHTLGIKAVVGKYTVKNVVTNGETSGSGGPDQKWLQETWLAEHADVKRRTISTADLPPATGLTDNVIDPIACAEVDPKIRVLWGHAVDHPEWKENDRSIALRVDFGQSSAFLMGDLEKHGIQMLVDRYGRSGVLDADLHKVGHHGSYNATTEALLEVSGPRSMGGPASASSGREVARAACLPSGIFRRKRHL